MAPDLQLLLRASGAPDIKQFALAHGYSEDTVRSWDKRGAVPTKHMQALSALYPVQMEAAKVHLKASAASHLHQLAELERPAAQGAVMHAAEPPPRWRNSAAHASPQWMSEAGQHGKPGLSRADLLRTRGAGAVQPLLLSLPLEVQGGPTGEYELIPMHVRSAAAGTGVEGSSGEPDQLNLAGHMAFSFEWLRRNLGHTTGQLTSIDVRGDSMAATLLDGDTIVIDEGVDGVDVDGIYVLDLYGRRLVKRVQHLFDGTLVLISDNPNYQRETIPRDQARNVRVIGRMVWPKVR